MRIHSLQLDQVDPDDDDNWGHWTQATTVKFVTIVVLLFPAVHRLPHTNHGIPHRPGWRQLTVRPRCSALRRCLVWEVMRSR